MSGLYTANETVAELAFMKQYYPDYVPLTQCEQAAIGVTYHNQTIRVLRLTAPNTGIAKTKVLLTAGHSATQPVGTSFLLYAMKQLMLQKDDPTVSFLLNTVEFDFVPVVNGDGLDAQAANFNATSSFAAFETDLNTTVCQT